MVLELITEEVTKYLEADRNPKFLTSPGIWLSQGDFQELLSQLGITMDPSNLTWFAITVCGEKVYVYNDLHTNKPQFQ